MSKTFVAGLIVGAILPFAVQAFADDTNNLTFQQPVDNGDGSIAAPVSFDANTSLGDLCNTLQTQEQASLTPPASPAPDVAP